MRRLAIVSLCLVACRDELVDPTNVHFEPDCDESGPVELLRLEDDEEVVWVSRVDDEGDLHVVVAGVEESTQSDASTWRHDVVIDRCGLEVTELAAGTRSVWRWEDALLGCVEGNLVRLASYDDPSPTILTRRGCAARLVGDRYVILDAEPGATVGRLVSLEAVGTEVSVRVLLDDVLVGEHELGRYPAVVDDRAFVQTADLALHSVDPHTGEVALELEEAGSWSAHADAIAYRAPGLDPDAQSPLFVRDRRTGAEQTLELGLPSSWWIGWWSDGLLVAGSSGPPIVDRWFRLDPVRELVPPEGMRIETVRDDGLVWLSRLDAETSEIELLRWREGEPPQSAWSCTWCGISPSFPFHEDALELRVTTPYPYAYELWRLEDAGGSAALIASGVGDEHHELPDGRVLTVPVGGDFEHGPLLLFPGAGGPAVTLAPRVNHRAAFFSWLYDSPDEILYETVPHEGVHALYRARLAP